jgi:hypothetical protein
MRRDEGWGVPGRGVVIWFWVMAGKHTVANLMFQFTLGWFSLPLHLPPLGLPNTSPPMVGC